MTEEIPKLNTAVPGFLVRNVIGKAEKNPEPWLDKLKNVNPAKLNNVIKINPEAFKGVNNNSVASNIKLSYNLKDMGTLKTFLAKQAASKNRPGLWANIRAKKARGGKPAKPGDEAYPDKKNWSKLTHKSADDQNGHPVLDTIGAGVVGTGLGALGGGAMARSNITSTQNGYYLDKLNRGLQTAKLRGINPKSMSLELEGAPEGVKLPAKFTGKIPAEAIERGWSPFAKIISKARGQGGLIGGGIGLAGMGLSHLFGGAGTQKQAGLENWKKLTAKNAGLEDEKAPIVDSTAQRKKDAIWAAAGNGVGGALGGGVLGAYASLLHPDVHGNIINSVGKGVNSTLKDSIEEMNQGFGEGWKHDQSAASKPFGMGAFTPEEKAARSEILKRTLAKQKMLKILGRSTLIGAGALGSASALAAYAHKRSGEFKKAGLENYEGMGTTDPTSSHQDILNGILRNQGQPTPAPTPVATPKPAPLPIPAPAPHYPAGQSAEGMPGNNAITPNHLNFLQDMQNMQQQHNQTLPAYNLGKQGESKLAACLAALNKLSLN